VLGGQGNQIAGGVAVHPSGNIYVAGSVAEGFGPVVITPANGFDVVVLELSPTGALLGFYVVQAAADQYVNAITVTSNAVYIAGTTLGALGGGTHLGSGDAFAAKLNLDLTALQWVRHAGGTGSDAANAVAVKTNGNVVVMGQTTSASVDGEINSGGWDFFYSEWTGDGTFVRSRVNGTGDATDTGLAGAVDTLGAVVMTGYSQPGSTNPYVVKWNDQGVVLFARRLTEIQGVGSGLVTVDTNSNVFIAGLTDQPILGQPALGGVADVFVAALNGDNGSLVWARHLGGTGADGEYPYMAGLAAGPCGLFVASQTNSVIGGQSPAGETDNVLFHLTFSGVPVWTRMRGGTGDEVSPHAVAYAPSGNVIQAGWTNGVLDGFTPVGNDLTVMNWTACR
jgi:hypothetical protein